MQKILKQVMQTALDEQRLVGMEVMVKRDGETLFHQAAGYADRESQRLMSVGERFRLASVSKPIVSTAAMMLVAAGRLSLDSDTTRWLPTFKPRQPDGSRALITLRQLLSHSAGLSYRFLEATPDGPYARAGVSDGMDATPLSLQENLQRLSTVPLLFTPGTAWCYSLAMDVVGAIIEQVQQQPLPEAIRSLVTGPLGMKQTGFSLSADQSVATAYVSDTPRPHILSEGEVVAPFEGTVGIPYSPARVYDPQAFPSGGAGMVGTVSDLMTLLEMLRSGGGTLLSPEWIAEMAQDQVSEHVLPDMPGVGFGLGFSILRDPLLAGSPESVGTWRWGGAYGHAWFVDPQQALSVVAFTNTLYEGMSGQFVNDLRNVVYQALQGA
ncbi:beta-lactamase family protein [Pantoea sp. Al-1710]|uniref:Beta-lactamase family protein n=1 Tax=Candidatus Pantoea communis TaxID=2608354 RepID=A0ABX0RKS4_9GAMM|nr:serine hydrolase domain-containing protein [Pantoea communis]NIG17216.1 beta-lactamase family protein [Pantoea communis]